MPLSSLLPRGAYLAPYLDASGLRVVLLIDRHRVLVYRYLTPGADAQAIMSDAYALLDILDPPCVTETT